uniref:Uncharacterized protein n=1 Tax=Sipha flava TaxID=143950 RepID=A0A2S2R9U3_9HEMI
MENDWTYKTRNATENSDEQFTNNENHSEIVDLYSKSSKSVSPRDSLVYADTRECNDEFRTSDQVIYISSELSDSDSMSYGSECYDIDTTNQLTSENNDEKELTELIQSVLNGETPVEDSPKWPSILLLHSQNSIEISKEQFQSMIMEKAADIIINKHKLGDLMFQTKIIKKEQNIWLRKLEYIWKFIRKTHEKLDKLDRKQPAPTTIKVRSVGTNVNMTPINNITEKPYEPRMYKDLPTINID